MNSSHVVGQQPECSTVCERLNGPEIPEIEGENRVGLELSREDNIHRISAVELQFEVPPAHCLCHVEDVGAHLGENGPACSS